MDVIEVFADVTCPFAYVGLRRFDQYRRSRGHSEPVMRVRAWPLELVNGTAMSGSSLVPKIAALRAGVAPQLFAGFEVDRFPSSPLPAMHAEAAAYRIDVETGEQFSLAVRNALFERGLDVSDATVLRSLRETHGVPEPTDDDRAAVQRDMEEGGQRQVQGSPHFFTPHGDFFCPSLEIGHDDGGFEATFDTKGFERFVAAVWTSS